MGKTPGASMGDMASLICIVLMANAMSIQAGYLSAPTTTTTMAPPRNVGPLNATCECKCFGITVPTTPLPPGPINVLVRKDVGNPADYFDKTFAEYKEGFSANGESWLGLENLYRLTSQLDYKLKIIMTDFDGKKYYA